MSVLEIDFPPLHKIINKEFIPLWNNTDRYLLLWGGRGSSKSDFTAKKLIKDCLSSSYFRFILVRDTYATIKDSQYQTIKDIVSDWGISHLFTFKENPLEIKCINGNSFLARGCDDVDKIKSIKDPTGAWYEEGNDIHFEDWITISSSIRTTKADYLQEVITFNPECDHDPNDHWLNKVFLKGRSERLLKDKIEIKLPSGIVLYSDFTAHHSTYKDNRWCSAQFIAFLEQLAEIDPYYYQVYCLGLWGLRQGKNPWANQYDPKKHESVRAVMDKSKQLFVSIDFNLDPFGVTFEHQWSDTQGAHIHQFNEAAIENGSMDKMIQYIGDSYGYFLPLSRWTGDFTGMSQRIDQPDRASLFRQLQKGLHLANNQIQVPPNPSHASNRTDVNYILTYHPDFIINPRTCPQTCMDFKTVQSDPNKFGHILKTNRKDVTQRADLLDCRRYSINTWQKPWIERHRAQNRYKAA